MKAVTLTVPWAQIIFCPDIFYRKCWETRSWSTSYRGPLAIHAAKGLAGMRESEMWILALSEPFRTSLEACGYMSPGRLPRGVILGTVDLADIFPTTARERLSLTERAFGDYGPGRYMWQLANPVLFPEPIPAKGALSLWEWTP